MYYIKVSFYKLDQFINSNSLTTLVNCVILGRQVNKKHDRGAYAEKDP